VDEVFTPLVAFGKVIQTGNMCSMPIRDDLLLILSVQDSLQFGRTSIQQELHILLEPLNSVLPLFLDLMGDCRLYNLLRLSHYNLIGDTKMGWRLIGF
jgi:hypothetical protein